MGVNSAPAAFPGSKDRMQINLVPDLSLFAVMAIFIVNYFVVSRFFLRPINDVLEARETEARTARKSRTKSPGSSACRTGSGN